MADRQTRNVSLPRQQEAFLDSMVKSGRYRTASEVVRDGLRLLEEAEHRRLLEAWIYEDLTPEQEAKIPLALRERVRAWFDRVVASAKEDVAAGRVKDGPAVIRRLRQRLEERRR